jgi:hypothetical protein
VRKKKAVRLSGEINGFMKNHVSEGYTHGMVLQSAWEQVATPQALIHTDNVVFSPKKDNITVLIYVDSSHWAAELGTQRELLRILMERETGWALHELKFLVTRKTALKKLFKKKQEQKQSNDKEIRSIPLTEDEDRYARKLVSPLKDEKLRNSLYKAMKADFEWKKGQKGLNLSQNPPESPEHL